MKRIATFLSRLKSGLTKFFSSQLQILLCLIFILFFGILSLPYISFKVGDTIIELPNIDMSSISPGSTIGNLRRGRDIFPTQVVKSQIDFNEDLSESEKGDYIKIILNRITQRIKLAGLYDIDLSGEIKDGIYYLVFNYPEYYQNVVGITTMLTKKGDIEFLDANQQLINLKDSDVSTNLDISYLPALQSHLKFGFPSEKTYDLQAALVQQYFYMSIDGQPELQLFQYEQSDPLTNTVRGLPIATETQNLVYRDLYINIIRTYFNEKEPLKYSVTVDQSIAVVPAYFGNLSMRYVGVISIIVFLALTIFSFIKFGIRRGIVFTLMCLSVVVFTITLLKYISAPLSLVLLITYFIFSGISILFIWRFLRSDDSKEVHAISNQLFGLGILLIISSLGCIRFITNIGRFYDALGVILVFGIGFIIFSAFNFKTLVQELIIKTK